MVILSKYSIIVAKLRVISMPFSNMLTTKRPYCGDSSERHSVGSESQRQCCGDSTQSTFRSRLCRISTVFVCSEKIQKFFRSSYFKYRLFESFDSNLFSRNVHRRVC